MFRHPVRVVCALAMVAAGCAGASPGSSPRATLRAFVLATRQSDMAAPLYALLPERARRAESLDAFRARMRAQEADLRALGEAVEQANASAATPVASVTLRDRSDVIVQEDSDGWRVTDPGFGPPAGATVPGVTGARAAVRGFHDALARHGAGAFMGVLSSRMRGNLEAEIAALRDATADAASLEYTSRPPETLARLPDGRYLALGWEGGAWRVNGVRDAP
jgi:hypothetical protein